MASSSTVSSWFAVRQELSPNRKKIIGLASFLLPLLIWCIVSYVPFIWHPMVLIENPGDVDYFQVEMLVDKATFNEEFNAMQRDGKAQPQGSLANPIYLPAPHAVAKALYTAFVTPPAQKDGTWLHESLCTASKRYFLDFLFHQLLVCHWVFCAVLTALWQG